MKEFEIYAANQIIADYMGFKREVKHKDDPYDYIIEGCFYTYSQLVFHSHWDWLMMVVERIEREGYRVTINLNNCYIKKYTGENEETICENLMEKSKIRAVWLTVIDFIKTQNTLKRP